MSDELRPCPFCGQTPTWEPLPPRFGPECQPGILLRHPFAAPTDAPCRLAGLRFAPGDWNTRPVEAALRTENVALRADIHQLRMAQVTPIKFSEQEPRDYNARIGLWDNHHKEWIWLRWLLAQNAVRQEPRRYTLWVPEPPAPRKSSDAPLA